MICFNTGRYYSKEGQRVIAEEYQGGVFFVDHDRGIDGYIEDCELSHSAIMSKYDKGQYGWIRRDDEINTILDKIDPSRGAVTIHTFFPKEASAS